MTVWLFTLTAIAIMLGCASSQERVSSQERLRRLPV